MAEIRDATTTDVPAILALHALVAACSSLDHRP
jgi:hypothetical protein